MVCADDAAGGGGVDVVADVAAAVHAHGGFAVVVVLPIAPSIVAADAAGPLLRPPPLPP